MAWITGGRRLSYPAPGGHLEKLAAVACGVWRGSSEQLLVNGRFVVCYVELHAIALPGTARRSFAQQTISGLGALVAGVPVDWLVVDLWFCSWRCVTANAVGKHIFVLCTLRVLFDTISRRFLAEIFRASFSPASALGSASRPANVQNEIEFGADRCSGYNSDDDSGLEQRSVVLVESTALGSELGVEFARMVPRRDGADTNLAEGPN